MEGPQVAASSQTIKKEIGVLVWQAANVAFKKSDSSSRQIWWFFLHPRCTFNHKNPQKLASSHLFIHPTDIYQVPLQCQDCSRCGMQQAIKYTKSPCPPGTCLLVRGDRLQTRYIIVHETETNAKKTSKAEKRARKYLRVSGLVCVFVLCQVLQEVNCVHI